MADVTNLSDGKVSRAAKRGDHVATLRAMRDRIAMAIDDPKTPARDLAALSKRLGDVIREIDGAQAAAAPRRRGNGRDETFDASAV